MKKEKSKEELEKKLQTLKKEKILLVLLLVVCIVVPNVCVKIHKSKDEQLEKDINEMVEWEEDTTKTCDERDTYTYFVRKYLGDYKHGSEVKLMIEDIITYNYQHSGEKGSFISVHNGTIGERENKIELFSTGEEFNDELLDDWCLKSNCYENTLNAENTEERVEKVTAQMRAFAKKISSGKRYKIEACEQDGEIYAVYVSTDYR